MPDPLCTIVVVPREQFSLAPMSYTSLCKTAPGYPIIYIDGHSPRSWARQLDALAADGKIQLIRTDFLISQHEAYNLAIPHLRTKYVIFVDNDVIFSPGWADNLVACAEETGGDVVMPLVEQKESGGDWHIHMCGGDCGVEEQEGRLWFREVHPLHGQARADLKRCQTGLIEYHTFLVRCETLQKTGPFDEAYWPTMDHTDFSLMIRAAGGTLWVEPSSLVRYVLPSHLKAGDLGFYMTRWSDALVEANQRHFSEKWGVTFPADHALWYRNFRRRDLLRLKKTASRFIGCRPTDLLLRLLNPVEALLSRLILSFSYVSNRRQRLEKLGAFRAPELDRAAVQAFADTIFRAPRKLDREIRTCSRKGDSVGSPNGAA